MSHQNNLTDEAIESLTARFRSITSLSLPGQLARGDREPTDEQRAKYLRALLSHDPGVFLERHGDLCSADELILFHPLRADSYEVDFYLKLLEDKFAATGPDQAAGPSGRSAAAGRTCLSAIAKNRRLAHMQRLEAEGYFSEDAMREREPYLHHLYIGQYAQRTENNGDGTDGAEKEGGPGPAGGEEAGGAVGVEERVTTMLAGSIMERQDELERLMRREAEREAYDQQEEESESDDEDGGHLGAGEGDRGGKRDEMVDTGPGEWPAPGAVTSEQRAEYAAAFEDAVKQRFLGGRDKDVDYAAIDADAGLDEHWAAEETRDAEERYFDAD